MPLPDRQTRNTQDTFDNVRLLNKLFYDTPAYSSAAHHPRMNLWASDQKAVVHALIPGVDK
jgi:HSP20 family molecular chaperone IbpA